MDLSTKNVLITGSQGMIGRYLTEKLLPKVKKLRLTDIVEATHKDAEYIRCDLRDRSSCLDVAYGMDVVFHLAGIKGSPDMAIHQPSKFLVPMLQFNTNMMEAARNVGVSWYLYTSSVGVYGPTNLFVESEMWNQNPSKNDWYGGWAKRIGEMQAMAYQLEITGDNRNWISIIRPANVYGRNDCFTKDACMVIPSLIEKCCKAADSLYVWGDGLPIRDFVHASDVAAAMIMMVEKEISQPMNIGSGKGYTIRELVNIILKAMNKDLLSVVWETHKLSGDKVRLMDMSLARSYGFINSVSLEDGIKDTVDWYLGNVV
jgi:GDP-L-fucose synthase